jgi:hypothetical protein
MQDMTDEELLAQMQRASSFRTICEVHREIYDGLGVLDEPLRSQLRAKVLEAFKMGKKIDARLREYKADWDAGFYQKNEDRRADRRARRA